MQSELAIANPLSQTMVRNIQCRAVATNVDILTCKIEGIVLGLELVNRYFNERSNTVKSESVNILNDCTVVCRAVLPSTASPGGGWGSSL